LETFRCPTCLFVLADSGQRRCPACNKRLKRRGRPIVLGDQTGFGNHEPIHIDLTLAERMEVEAERRPAPQELAPEVKPPKVKTPKPKPVRTKRVKSKTVRRSRSKTKRDNRKPEPLVASVAASVEAQLVDTAMLDTPLVVSPPLVTPPTASEPVTAVADEPDGIEHTTIFAPSQFDPEMRQTLDSLYRKARAKSDD
jgi:hypothetical protein